MQPRWLNKPGRFTVPVELANSHDMLLAREGLLDPAEVRRVTTQGVVGSGSAKLILPKSLADRLGLKCSATVKVRYADRRIATRETTSGAHVTLLGREGDFTAIIEPKRTGALIGAIVLEDLDLLVDCQNKRLVPRDPNMALYEIE